MIIGVPKERKTRENRVGLTPDNVREIIDSGHEVWIETKAGAQSRFEDQDYVNAGAKVVPTAEEVWQAEMVVKVKEPQPSEYQYFREGQILFCYLHLASERELAEALVEKKVTGIAYETMTRNGRKTPLLMPMSEVAGRMAVQTAAHLLEQSQGGRGILLGGIPGVGKANVTIIGGGVVGENAAHIAQGMGASVTIIDINPNRLAELENTLGQGLHTLMSNEQNIHDAVIQSDVVIGSVLIPGREAPVLVKEETVKQMKPGAVMIDIAVDQGGNFETTTHSTTFEDPTYIVHDVVHYAVANVPGAVPRTSTIGLTNVSLPYVKWIASAGLIEAVKQDIMVETGINTYQGHITHYEVATSLDMHHEPLSNLIPAK